MKILLFGAPGSGKGTQAEVLEKKLGIPIISTGNILREAIRSGAEVGLRAKEYTDSGRLVPDDVIVDIIKERIARPDCANGYILDGFPRTAAQAEVLDSMGVQPDAVLALEVSDEEIERRLTGRRVCSGCGASYHVHYHAPSAEGICDSCGGEVIIRPDDKPETVRARLITYHEQTEPLKGFYERRGLLKIVVSCELIEDTTKRCLSILGIA